MNFLIPVSFEFRTTKVKWAGTRAHIKGWWKRSDETVDYANLIADFTYDGTARVIPFPLERLPDHEWQQCCEHLDEGCFERICDGEVRQVCSTFEPQFLVRSDRTFDIPHSGPIKPSQPSNAWHMRDAFLRLKLDCAEAIGFLDVWGSWDFREYALLADLVDLQQAVREGLTSPPNLWFAKQYSVLPILRTRPKSPYLAILTDKCEMALRMTVTIDLLRKAKFETCARRDCGMPFEITSGHTRQYCRPYCSHLESIRRARKKPVNE